MKKLYLLLVVLGLASFTSCELLVGDIDPVEKGIGSINGTIVLLSDDSYGIDGQIRKSGVLFPTVYSVKYKLRASDREWMRDVTGYQPGDKVNFLFQFDTVADGDYNTIIGYVSN